MADVYETIANAADKYGVPVEALLAIAKIESNFSAGADNPYSSASGLFQFTDGTAGDMGLTGAKRNDIEAQAEAAAKMAAGNSRSLASALGRTPTPGEIYLAHQQGLAGAKALLANPDKPASEVLARFHGNNTANVIRQNGGNLNMTAGEFAGQWVNKGNKTAGLFPPGEIPKVATALATVPTPRNAPAPVTPSLDMAQMRRISAPSQLVPDTFASLNKPRRTLGDELGMSPIQGGQQQAPMFDAAFDERTGTMRLTREPMDTQGMYVGRSREPAPVPAMPSPQLAARRATDPTLQAALNDRYQAKLPPLPPPSPALTASDRVRGNPMQTREEATTIASIPTTTPFPTTEQIVAGTGFRQAPAIPERLAAGVLPPALYGGGVAGVGTNAVAPTPFARPTQFAQAPRIAPVPFQRPTAVGSALSVRPVPPMPVARPAFGMGGGERPAPVPVSMSPFLAMRRAVPVLRPAATPAARRVWMSGFSDSESSGGAHGGSSD